MFRDLLTCGFEPRICTAAVSAELLQVRFTCCPPLSFLKMNMERYLNVLTYISWAKPLANVYYLIVEHWKVSLPSMCLICSKRLFSSSLFADENSSLCFCGPEEWAWLNTDTCPLPVNRDTSKNFWLFDPSYRKSVFSYPFLQLANH